MRYVSLPLFFFLLLMLTISSCYVEAWSEWLTSPFHSISERKMNKEKKELNKESPTDTSTSHGRLFSHVQLPPLSIARHKFNIQYERHVSQLLTEIEARGRLSQCWKSALDTLKEGCASLRTDDGARSRLAFSMASCDAEADGGHHRWPRCTTEDDVRNCVRKLDDARYLVYVQYRLHTDVLCLYIQEESFQERTEMVVQNLYAGAVAASEALETLQGSSNELHLSVLKASEQQIFNLAEIKKLYDQLQELRSGQTMAFESLQESTHRVMRSVLDAGLSLKELHLALDESAAHATSTMREMANEAAAFQSRTEIHSASMLNLLERVELFQKLLLEGTIGLSEALRSALLITVILLLTIPNRTAAARLPCIAFVALVYAFRPLLPTVPYHVFGSNIFFAILSLTVGGIIILFACAYRSPEYVLQKLLRGEMRRALDDTRPLLLQEIRQLIVEGVSEVIFREGRTEEIHSRATEELTMLAQDEINEEFTPPTVTKAKRRKASRSRSRLH